MSRLLVLVVVFLCVMVVSSCEVMKVLCVLMVGCGLGGLVF